jgi:Zn-dependent protease
MLGLDPSVLLPRAITLIIALTVHEFSHAWVATAYGDETPRAAGRLTLNPLRHLDIMGSLMLIFVGFGWAKPVPVNPYALERRSPSALMWVSLAGPFSNFLLAVLAAIPLRTGLVQLTTGSLSGNLTLPYFLLEFILINLTLMLFNLLPVAPLDGEKIAAYVLPPSAGRFLEQMRQFGPIVLILLLFVLPRLGIDVFGSVIYPVLYRLMNILIGTGG